MPRRNFTGHTYLEEAHCFDVVPLIKRETVIYTGRDHKQISLGDMDADPLVFARFYGEISTEWSDTA